MLTRIRLLVSIWKSRVNIVPCHLLITGSASYRSTCHIHTAEPSCTNQLTSNERYCFQLLNLKEDCSYEDLREAYISQAKKYHPDSPSSTAIPQKFLQIKEAYRVVKKYMENVGKEVSHEDEETDFGIKHTAPQHRQYLTYEGIGFGTPAQRQKQYQQYKINIASENVYEYRTQKLAASYESSLVSKDKRATRRTVVRKGLDRLVEDLIQESMARGDFDDLPGKGKKIEYKEHNPMVDTFTHNLNRIMINNGYAPEWVMLDKEIRESIKSARQALLEKRGQLGKEPFTSTQRKQWQRCKEEFNDKIVQVNTSINKFNFLVPTIRQQLVPYKPEKELDKVLEGYIKLEKEGYFERIKEQERLRIEQFPFSHVTNEKPVSFRDVWTELRSLLRFSMKR